MTTMGALIVLGLCIFVGNIPQASCLSCNLGYFMHGERCEPCPPGEYKNDYDWDSYRCKKCPHGTFNGDWAQTSCKDCPTGSHQPNTGQTQCEACPPGTTSRQNQTYQCYACLNGTYQPESGKSSCLSCPAGSFQASHGKAVCQDCPKGMYQDETGQSQCKQCPAGTYQPLLGQNQTSSCIKCEAGTFSEPGSSFCQPCPTGQFQHEHGQSKCKNCPIGTRQNLTGQTNCTGCSPGTFQNQTGLARCRKCSTGSYQNEAEQASCIPCPAGEFQSATGMTDCVKCPIGYYQSKKGQAGCMRCPVNTITTQIGSKSCIACPPAQISNRERSSCESCSADAVRASGEPTCRSCNVDEVTNAAQTECETNILATPGIKTGQSCPDPEESKKAIDGEKYNDCHCTKLQRQENPWWGALLSGFYSITKVILQTRQKCCTENLYNISVFVGNHLNDRRYLCGTYDGPALIRGRVHIACNQPLLGKAITIVKNAIDSLVLCEVFAVGTPAQEPPCLRKSESISCGKKGKTGKKRCTSEGLKKIVEVINVPSSGCGNPENYGVSDNRYELWTKKKCAGNFTVSVCDTQDPCIAKKIQTSCKGQDKICPIDGTILDIVRVLPKHVTCVDGENFGITEDSRGVWVNNGCKVKFILKVCDDILDAGGEDKDCDAGYEENNALDDCSSNPCGTGCQCVDKYQNYECIC